MFSHYLRVLADSAEWYFWFIWIIGSGDLPGHDLIPQPQLITNKVEFRRYLHQILIEILIVHTRGTNVFYCHDGCFPLQLKGTDLSLCYLTVCVLVKSERQGLGNSTCCYRSYIHMAWIPLMSYQTQALDYIHILSTEMNSVNWLWQKCDFIIRSCFFLSFSLFILTPENNVCHVQFFIRNYISTTLLNVFFYHIMIENLCW